jgi:hypothetical protein
MTSIGIGEESILYEAKYVFKDFTQIERLYTDFNRSLTEIKQIENEIILKVRINNNQLSNYLIA